MRRKELSARLGRHLERGEGLMELNRAAAERNTQAFEQLMAAFDRHEQAFERVTAALDRHEAQTDDLKIFIREINKRGEKVIQEMLRRSEEFNAEQSRRTDAIVSHLNEVSEEQRAQRRALLAILDRLPPPAQAA